MLFAIYRTALRHKPAINGTLFEILGFNLCVSPATEERGRPAFKHCQAGFIRLTVDNGK